MKNRNVVRIKLWGTSIGYLYQEENRIVNFQYDEDFLNSGIELAPIKMPLSKLTYSFPNLSEETFHGLPGLVADSLPDKFGTIVMNRYLESQGRTADIKISYNFIQECVLMSMVKTLMTIPKIYHF